VNAFKTPCNFLEGQKCRIYDVRPSVCRIYPFSEKNIGFITLVLCPLGDEIVDEFNNALLHAGKPKANFIHDDIAQKAVDDTNKIFEMVGYDKGESKYTTEVGFEYNKIPFFLKYLRSKKGGR
ncbi:MAG: YkgJ family cysteine cluster protein, partial [Candidatus Methanoperedens sp.]|nr:YkgJ family cysteine cluster protein [Candidatus Methanoperedens sp.]